MFFQQLFVSDNLGLFILRLAVATVFIYHSFPKLKNYKQMAGFPGGAGGALILGLVEFSSSIAMILGIYLQAAALLLALVMAGAIYMKLTKWHAPFSANDKTGWEFDLILLAANLAILFSGGGSIKLI